MSNRKRPSQFVTFALSFLDVLCCGLGAAVLLLLIVKHGPAEASLDSTQAVSTRLEQVQSDVDSKLGEKESLGIQLELSMQEISSAASNMELQSAAKAKRMTEFREQLAVLSNQREQAKAAAEELEALRAEREAQLARSEEPKDDAGQSGQLAGLPIAQDRVVILLDRSASMLDHTLVEIIRLRASPIQHQLTSEKWMTARDSAMWATSRIRTNKNFQLLLFSDEVADLDGNVLDAKSKLDWLQKDAPNRTSVDINRVVDAQLARGATNLRQALEVTATLSPQPNQILIITDGLPTVPGSKALSRIRNCPRIVRTSSPILSPRCRANIFRDAESFAANVFKNTRIDIILLPLEGDASAALRYWELAVAHDGRMLTPAKGWPFR